MIGTLFITAGALATVYKANKSRLKKRNILKKEENLLQTIKKNSAIVFSSERRQKMEAMADERYDIKSPAEKRGLFRISRGQPQHIVFPTGFRHPVLACKSI